MRVIAGELRSRQIRTIRGLDVRPTPDRLREALFNVLAPQLPGRTFLDAYAGCGSVGIEAISRGAARVIFVERSRRAIQMIRENLRSLGVADGFEIHSGKAGTLLARLTADIAFLDPPYDRVDEYEAALDALAANPPPLTIVQHATRYHPPDCSGPLRRYRALRQGDNSLSFYEPEVAPANDQETE